VHPRHPTRPVVTGTMIQRPRASEPDPRSDVERRLIGVVVLGMSRSGTSAVTAMFAAAGFHVGPQSELMGPSEANRLGFFERLDIWRLNEEILSELGGTWFDPPTLRAQQLARASVQPLIDRRFAAVVEEAGGAPVAIKDPRIGVLFDLWGGVIREQLHPVLVIRDPVEIARSLAQRDQTPTAFGLAAWEIHMSSLLRHLQGRVVTVARYPELLCDPCLPGQIVKAACEQLADDVGVRVTAALAQHALAPALHRSTALAGEHEQQMTVNQAKLWNALNSLPGLNQVINPPEDLMRTGAAVRLATQSERDRIDLTTHAGELEAELVERQAQLIEREAQLVELKALLAEIEGERLELELQYDRTTQLLSSEREQARVAETTIQRLTETRDRLVQSRSWTLTAPLRSIAARSRALSAQGSGLRWVTGDRVRTETAVDPVRPGSAI
jgi:hypothetical protein